MIQIDGMAGEGGGQILRTSLALSLVTGKSFEIKNIRAKRKKPGLMRQHLTCVRAAKEIGSACAKGDAIGSEQLVFEPGPVMPGNYHFAIGTAGSCTLVLQTVLPALLVAKDRSGVTLEGGTHNPFAPPFDFFEHAFIKQINQMGPTVTAVLDRPGFYPAGGGQIKVDVTPAPLKGVDISQRGEIVNKTGKVLCANLPENIAVREVKTVKKLLGWENLETVNLPDSRGPGNILTLVVESRHITEVFTGFGIKGVTAEKVAKRCAGQVKSYLAADVPVGRFLADQLLVPMSMAGRGSFITQAPSRHTTTNIEVIKQFLDLDITCEQVGEDQWKIKITAMG